MSYPFASRYLDQFPKQMNKVIKDIIVKFQPFGEEQRLCAGWDCHGMPIEHKVVEN